MVENLKRIDNKVDPSLLKRVELIQMTPNKYKHLQNNAYASLGVLYDVYKEKLISDSDLQKTCQLVIETTSFQPKKPVDTSRLVEMVKTGYLIEEDKNIYRIKEEIIPLVEATSWMNINLIEHLQHIHYMMRSEN